MIRWNDRWYGLLRGRACPGLRSRDASPAHEHRVPQPAARPENAPAEDVGPRARPKLEIVPIWDAHELLDCPAYSAPRVRIGQTESRGTAPVTQRTSSGSPSSTTTSRT